MNKIEDNKKQDFIDKINFKFYSYFIKYQLAKYDENIIGQEVKANHNENFKLSSLEIDKIAREKKIAILEEEKKYKEKISKEISDKIVARMDITLNKEDLMFSKLVDLPEILFVLLDKLYLKSTTLSHLETIIGQQRWLERQFKETIKTPHFSKQLEGSNVKVDNIRTIIGLVGEMNLKLLIPSYIINYNIPKNDSFPLIGRKIYEHALSTANACYVLAQKQDKVNPFIAYTAGFFHEIGTVALFKLYLNIFDIVWKEELKDARDKFNQKRFLAISHLEPSQKHMRDVFFHNSSKYTKNIVKDFNFERLPIKDILIRFSNKNKLNEDNEEDFISPYVDILDKANSFSEIKELHDVRLVNDNHFSHFLQFKNLNKEEITLLRKRSLKSIPLFKTGE
jgi:hypothetical protein